MTISMKIKGSSKKKMMQLKLFCITILEILTLLLSHIRVFKDLWFGAFKDTI